MSSTVILSRPSRSALAPTLGFFFCLLATAGCMATVQPATMVVSEDVEYVDSTPVNVEQYPDQYPQESYGGRTVIYVGGRWQYRAGARWMAYRHEPVELGRRRTVRRPPPAHGGGRQDNDKHDKDDRRDHR
jgi:hypothetical protein